MRGVAVTGDLSESVTLEQRPEVRSSAFSPGVWVLDLLESSHQEAFPSALKPQSLGGAETHCGLVEALGSPRNRGQEGAGQETRAAGKFFLAPNFLAFPHHCQRFPNNGDL